MNEGLDGVAGGVHVGLRLSEQDVTVTESGTSEWGFEFGDQSKIREVGGGGETLNPQKAGIVARILVAAFRITKTDDQTMIWHGINLHDKMGLVKVGKMVYNGGSDEMECV